MTSVLARRELDAAGIEDAALRAGYLRCRNLNAAHGRTYYLATLLLPAAKRPYVHALYGLARYLDDIVDEQPDRTVAERAARLEAWATDFQADLDWGAAGDPVARAALDLGCFISFSGIITFRNAGELREVARYVPLDRCLIETDSPYLAPVPHRGKTNSPAYVPFVAQQLAELKGETLEAIAQATSRNFERLFPVVRDEAASA